ncbi:MAG: hypothetical protein KQ78_00855 [Candidatus Izimaplasma bacterium HR2]|nr:MAG: hypothetical protein KQ78_00855 [Candidatus Izimaplasma bacterium HR2]
MGVMLKVSKEHFIINKYIYIFFSIFSTFFIGWVLKETYEYIGFGDGFNIYLYGLSLIPILGFFVLHKSMSIKNYHTSNRKLLDYLAILLYPVLSVLFFMMIFNVGMSFKYDYTILFMLSYSLPVVGIGLVMYLVINFLYLEIRDIYEDLPTIKKVVLFVGKLFMFLSYFILYVIIEFLARNYFCSGYICPDNHYRILGYIMMGIFIVFSVHLAIHVTSKYLKTI